MSELLFTGQVPIPNIAAAADKTGQILQNYSTLKAAENKAKADAYKRQDALANSVRKQMFGNADIGKIPASIRPAAVQGIMILAEKASGELLMNDAMQAGQTIALSSGFIQDLVPPDLSRPRGEFLDQLGNPAVNQNTVIQYDYSEEALAAYDDTYNLTGAQAYVDFDDKGVPTMMVTLPGSTEAVPHSQTEAYMGTTAYKPTPTMRAPITDAQLADRYLEGYQKSQLNFSEKKYREEFPQLFGTEELETGENIALETNLGEYFWKLTNEISALGEEKGYAPIAPTDESYVALSSGDSSHPINQGAYIPLQEEAIQRLIERSLPVARSKFKSQGRKPSANTSRNTTKENQKDFLNSVSDAPVPIPFEDEQGNERTLYGYRYQSSKIEGLAKELDVDNTKANEAWNEGLQDAIDNELKKAGSQAENPANARIFTDFARNEYVETFGEEPAATVKIPKVQAIYKAYDPETNEFRMFVTTSTTDSKTGSTSQSQFYFFPPTGMSYYDVNNIIKNDLDLEGGFENDLIKGAQGYEPPQSTEPEIPGLEIQTFD